MKIHELKTEPEGFFEVQHGYKTAEVRHNDRDFKRGDILVLRELYAPDDEYQVDADYSDRQREQFERAGVTDRYVLLKVIHVYEGGRHGIQPGYVLLSFKHIDEPA